MNSQHGLQSTSQPTPAFPSSLISRHSSSSTPHTVQLLQVPQCPSNSPYFTELLPVTSVLSALQFLINFDSSWEVLHKPYHLHVKPFCGPPWKSLECSFTCLKALKSTGHLKFRATHLPTIRSLQQRLRRALLCTDLVLLKITLSLSHWTGSFSRATVISVSPAVSPGSGTG